MVRHKTMAGMEQIGIEHKAAMALIDTAVEARKPRVVAQDTGQVAMGALGRLAMRQMIIETLYSGVPKNVSRNKQISRWVTVSRLLMKKVNLGINWEATVVDPATKRMEIGS